MSDLNRSLKSRHIMMMTLGGAIGAGIFKGSGTSIGLAGPSVVLTYLVGGLILLAVMKSIAVMVLKNNNANNLKDLIEPVLGPFAGYLVGWIYWLDWVLVMAAETAAASSFLQYWFPAAPIWVLALIVSVAMTLLNLLQVRVYGESEYWLAAVKIVTLSLFVIFGAILLVTRFSAYTVGQNITGHGGLFPHGATGLVSAMLVVMFSFGGTEMVGMTLGETDHPEQVIPRAARNVIIRILLFYILPISVIVMLVPWNGLGSGQSPFVTVFQEIGIPYVGGIMNFVMLTAVLSAINTGMYATSRILRTRAIEGHAPKALGKLSKHNVPVRALLFSTVFLLIGVVVAFFAKGNAFNDLMVVPSYSVMFVWMILLLGRIRQEGIRAGSGIALLALIAIFIGVAFTTPAVGSILTACMIVVVVLSYVFLGRRKGVGRE